MNDKTLTTLAAFDISDTHASPTQSSWPDLQPANGYRWIHLDLAEATAKQWTAAYLPEIADLALWQSETRPRCERLEDGLILNLRGVNLNPQSDPEDMVSLRIWVTPQAIVTARLRKLLVMEHMRDAAQDGVAPKDVGRFLADLAFALTDRIERVSLSLEEQTDLLEDRGSDGGKQHSAEIAGLRQTVIKLRRFINPQREAIAILASIQDWVIAPQDLDLLRETSNKTRRIVEELDATRDRLSALQDQMDADRAHVLSRNSYVLSVVAAIFLPLGFVTGLFGVNVGGMPGTTSDAAFWVLTIASALCGVALFIIFKFSKWL